MARLIRVFIDLDQSWIEPYDLTLKVGDQIRTGPKHTSIDMLLGQTVDTSCVEVALQCAEDIFRSAIGRTIGVHNTLPF